MKNNCGNIVQGNFNKKLFKANSKNQSKINKFSLGLKFGSVCIVFNGTRKGLLIPCFLRNSYSVNFRFDYSFNIGDFEFDQKNIYCTLQFKEGYCFCVVSWDSIFAMRLEYNNNDLFWFDDMPDQVRVNFNL